MDDRDCTGLSGERAGVISAHTGDHPAKWLDVTVVIPVKDRAGFVGDAIRSVLGQVYPVSEIIVIDDGSRDDSGDVAAALGTRVIRNETSRSLGPARNQGLHAARTSWVAFLDDDDMWLPDHLKNLVEAVGASDICLATAPARATDGSWRGNPFRRPMMLDPATLLVPGEGIVASGTMVRRSSALDVGGFPALPLCEDLATWLALLDRGSGVSTSEPTVIYRIHPAQMSKDGQRMREAADSVVASFADRPWFTRRLQRKWRSRLIWDGLRAAQRRGDWRGVAYGLYWYAVHPDALPALLALLRWRAHGRRAALAYPQQNFD